MREKQTRLREVLDQERVLGSENVGQGLPGVLHPQHLLEHVVVGLDVETHGDVGILGGEGGELVGRDVVGPGGPYEQFDRLVTSARGRGGGAIGSGGRSGAVSSGGRAGVATAGDQNEPENCQEYKRSDSVSEAHFGFSSQVLIPW